MCFKYSRIDQRGGRALAGGGGGLLGAPGAHVAGREDAGHARLQVHAGDDEALRRRGGHRRGSERGVGLQPDEHEHAGGREVLGRAGLACPRTRVVRSLLSPSNASTSVL